MNKINSINKPNYYLIASLTVLTITAITATVFIGMHHWQIAKLRQSISTFFSKNLAVKAAVVGIVAASFLLFPFGAASILSYKSTRLKSKYYKDNDEMIKAVIRHNSSLISRCKAKLNLDALLEPITQMMIDDPNVDPLNVLKKLSTLSLDLQLEDYIPEEEAKYYLRVTESKESTPLTQHCSKAVKGLVAVADNLIGAIGIGDLVIPTENSMQASIKAQKILMLVSILQILASILIPTVGVKMAGIIIGSSLAGLTFLSIIWPFIKPIPSKLPCNSINLTNKAIANKIKSSDARQDICDQLYNALKSGKHAMLIGPSRTGKTQAFESFVEKVNRGEYPELKGKIVFYWNTADLAAHEASTLMGGTSNPLASIADSLGENMDLVILCLDEIHSAMSKESFPEQMKTAFDQGGPFKHVIGITTTEEFEKHIAPNKALAKRFQLIPVGNMDPDSTLRVLNDRILVHPNMPFLEPNVLTHLITHSTDSNSPEQTPQPYTASNILDECIDQLDGDVMSHLQGELTRLRNQLNAIFGAAIISGSPITAEDKAKIANLRARLNETQAELSDKQEQQKAIDRAKKLLGAIRREKYRIALKLLKNEKLRTRYTVLKAFEASIVKNIKDASAKLGIKATITKKLVDDVIRKRRAQ